MATPNTGGFTGDDEEEFLDAMIDAELYEKEIFDAENTLVSQRTRRFHIEDVKITRQERPAEVFKARMTVQETPIIIFPRDMLSICDALQAKLPRTEFSILMKGAWTRDGFVVTPREYAVPKQTVSCAAVDYDHEDVARLSAEGYNCVLHSHPMDLTTFSGSDEATINTNFTASLLYCRGNLTDARVCIPIAHGLKFRLKADVEWSPAAGDILGFENITRDATPVSRYKFCRDRPDKSYRWPPDPDGVDYQELPF
jgi:hypothetical protein